MKSQYTAFVGCQSCQTHVGSSALAVRVGTTQSPTWYCNRSLHNLFMYNYILSWSCSLCTDTILKLLTNLLAITMLRGDQNFQGRTVLVGCFWGDQNFQGRTNFTRKYGPGDHFFQQKFWSLDQFFQDQNSSDSAFGYGFQPSTSISCLPIASFPGSHAPEREH